MADRMPKAKSKPVVFHYRKEHGWLYGIWYGAKEPRPLSMISPEQFKTLKATFEVTGVLFKELPR